jgi:hypothetical protein
MLMAEWRKPGPDATGALSRLPQNPASYFLAT